MLEKEYEILKQIEELYSGDISDNDFLKKCEGKEVRLKAWREAFKEYPLFEVQKAIDFYYTKKSSSTRPNIAQIRAILTSNNAHFEEKPTEEVFDYKPDLDVLYFDEDIKNGSCHHNKYYYTEALVRIRRHEYPIVADNENPTHSEMITVIEHLCESRTGKKEEFLSDNDLKTLGYDMSRKYSMDEILKNTVRKK
jgi:hypothetical protein